MGEDYRSDDEMVQELQAEEDEYQRKIQEKFAQDLPEQITTDFSQFDGD